MSGNIALQPALRPEQVALDPALQPHLFQEVDPQQLAKLLHAASAIASLPVSESALDIIPEKLGPAVRNRSRLTRTAAAALPLIVKAMPLVEIAKEHIDGDTDIAPEEIVDHMPAVRALAPLARGVMEITPWLAGGDDFNKRHAVASKLKPAKTMVARLRIGNTLAGVGLGNIVDKKMADVVATQLNARRGEARDLMATEYDHFIVPVTDTLDELVAEFPHPRRQLERESGIVADLIWRKSGLNSHGETDAKTVGQVIESTIRAIQHDKKWSQTHLPLLTKLGLDRLPEIRRTVALDDKFAIRTGLMLSGTHHSESYAIRDKYDDPHDKIDIDLADALGVAAAEIMEALESAAGRTSDPEISRRIVSLRYDTHPLRDTIRSFAKSIESQITRATAVGSLIQAARDLLPEDAAHAQRIKAALERTLRPKPKAQ